jgi:hypothetical protein
MIAIGFNVGLAGKPAARRLVRMRKSGQITARSRRLRPASASNQGLAIA